MNKELMYELYCSMDWLFWKQLTEEEAFPMFISRFQKHLSKKIVVDKKIIDELIEKYTVEHKAEQSIEAWYVLDDLQSLLPNNTDG